MTPPIRKKSFGLGLGLVVGLVAEICGFICGLIFMGHLIIPGRLLDDELSQVEDLTWISFRLTAMKLCAMLRETCERNSVIKKARLNHPFVTEATSISSESGPVGFISSLPRLDVLTISPAAQGCMVNNLPELVVGDVLFESLYFLCGC